MTTTIPVIEEQQKYPIYLTNFSAENTGHANESDFQQLGLEGGEFEGEWYPLTDSELSCVYNDMEFTSEYADNVFILCAYTALYKGKKWLYPHVICYFDTDNPSDSNEEETLKQAQKIYSALISFSQEHDFHVHMEIENSGYEVKMLLPFDFVQKNIWTDYKDWYRCLFFGPDRSKCLV